MRDWTPIRERYLRDALPIRLGGLAANLSRIKSFSTHDASRAAVETMIDESKHFIEWTAAAADIQTAAYLVEVQIQLARWQLAWSDVWSDPLKRRQMAERSAIWSRRVLELSGLVKA